MFLVPAYPDGKLMDSVRVRLWPEAVTWLAEPLTEHCELESEPLPPIVSGPINPLAASFSKYIVWAGTK